MSEPKRIARVSPGTLYREVQGEAVLLQLDNGEYFGLDEVATRIWQLLVEHGDLSSVQTAMLEEFDTTAEEVAGDLTRLIEELVAKRLIEVEEIQPR